MASLMEELLDVLGKEEKQYQELITLASEKQMQWCRAISNILRMLRRESRMLRACFLIFPIKETVS